MDEADRAQATEELFGSLATRKGAGAAIDDALVREGVRICADCEEPIPLERLQRVPNARRCRACQTSFERSPERLGDR